MRKNILQSTKAEPYNASWNPVTGCYLGCEYCYARKMITRLADVDPNYPLTKGQIHEVAEGTYPFLFEPTLYTEVLVQPINSRKPKNVYVSNMGELFADYIPDEWIKKVFDSIDQAPQHTYFFLTKNTKRYETDFIKEFAQTHINTWWGTTVESTATADRINYLPQNANCFVNCEPIQSEIDWEENLLANYNIKWLVVGAEAGRRAILPKYEWIEKLRQDCNKTGIRMYEKDSLKDVVSDHRELVKELWVKQNETETVDN